MPKTKITKEKISISIDKEIVQFFRKHNFKLSTVCNELLLSQLSNLSSLSPLQGEDRRFNSGQVHLREWGKKRLEIGEKHPTDLIYNSKYFNIHEERKDDITAICLKSIYFKTKSMYFKWGGNKFSPKYWKTITKRSDNLFNHVNTIVKPIEILNAIERYNLEPQYTLKGVRNFLNFLEEKDLIPESKLIEFRNKIKLTTSNNVDTFVPTKQQISDSIKFLKEYYPEFVTYYKLILESGCRYTEFLYMLNNYDEKNIETWDDKIIIYRNFFLRKNKSSFYLFFTKKTFDKLDINKFNKKHLESFKDRTIRNKEIISLKYLRKYQFTLMLENNVPIQTADFIQGRSSSSVGFNHYANQKLLAVKQYQKINNKFY